MVNGLRGVGRGKRSTKGLVDVGARGRRDRFEERVRVRIMPARLNLHILVHIDAGEGGMQIYYWPSVLSGELFAGSCH